MLKSEIKARAGSAQYIPTPHLGESCIVFCGATERTENNAFVVPDIDIISV
jgi:hypothetical protein